jgi:hypothetical protein
LAISPSKQTLREAVFRCQKAARAMLCGFFDEKDHPSLTDCQNIPPTKIFVKKNLLSMAASLAN